MRRHFLEDTVSKSKSWREKLFEIQSGMNLLFQDQAYAGPYIKTAKIAEFLLIRLEPVDVEILDLNDRGCTLC